MYLKSLALHGFKSFADKTLFEFHKGVTGIVGSNGCGKSNVVDAIRWVLGETSAKALRGGEMADVIFNGTEGSKRHKKRGASNLAEVTMTLAGCGEALKSDYDEIAITRRVHRDGKSEYRINGTLCRLRDIHELFMDTGIGRTAYSIMEQGKIDMLLSSKPEDRRMVFEEAAGITKFKKDKKEALRKLEYTEANLLRVTDVLEEQGRRMNSLKRQVTKARKYQILAEDVRILDTHHAHHRFTTLNAERGELTTSLGSLGKRRDFLEENLPTLEDNARHARDRAQRLESQLSDLRQHLSDAQNEATTAESKLAFNKERRIDLEQRIEKNHAEIEITKEKLNQQEFEFSATNDAIEERYTKIQGHQQDVTAQQSVVSQLNEERNKLQSSLRQARLDASSAQTLLATTQGKIESSISQAEAARQRLNKITEDEQRIATELEEAKSKQTTAETEVETMLSKVDQMAKLQESADRAYQQTKGEHEAARKGLDQANAKLTQQSARLQALQDVLAKGEGLQQGTRNVLKGLDDPQLFKAGVLGVLSSRLEVTDEHATAIEAVLGDTLQAIIVRDTEFADTIIDRLTSKQKGQATLIPLDLANRNHDRELLGLPSGATAWALDAITAKSDIADLIERLLGKVLIVPDLKTALSLQKSDRSLSFVTPNGDLLNQHGIIRGGHRSGDSLLQRQNEITTIEKDVVALTATRDDLAEALASLESQIFSAQEEYEQTRDRAQQHRIETRSIEGQLKLLQRETQSLENKLRNIHKEREDLQSGDQSTHSSRQELEAQLLATRTLLAGHTDTEAGCQSTLNTLDTQRDEQNQRLSELQTTLAVEQRAHESAAQQQAPMQTRMAELRAANEQRVAETENFQNRINNTAEQDEQLATSITDNQALAKEFQGELNELSSNREAYALAITDTEKKLSDSRTQIDQLSQQFNREEISATKLDLKLENLTNKITERHQIEIGEFRPDFHTLHNCVLAQKNGRPRDQQLSLAAKLAAESEQSEVTEDSPRLDLSPKSAEDLLDDLPTEHAEPDWKFIDDSLSELKRKLDAIGPVNLDAIQEFDELEERNNFLQGQHDDLVNSKGELLSVIEKINTETTKRFAETFKVVRDNFREMFKELFGEGAKADLILMDDDNPLESGIEVIAKPPGKKLQSITLLSGGERSMTAVALLFSIYMVKPSPFCVLDELDAPLDESNIQRFLKVLDRFIDQSQFIVVTHSKRTMARADVMYGVAMEEFGVSKPIGMNFTPESKDNRDHISAL